MRTILLIVAGVAAAGGILFLLANGQTPAAPAMTPAPAPRTEGAPPHRYNDPDTPLERVHIAALYFVPRDRTALVLPDWRERMEKALEEMRAFHRLQFLGQSGLDYEIADELIIGEESSTFYDSADTNRGNPHARKTVGEELDRRLGTGEGLTAKGERNAGSRSEESSVSHSPFAIRLVLYEGVGALGGEKHILVSSAYLKTPIAASVFYHELGHTFGLEDAYEYEHGAPLDEDIMGLGRNKPISQAYLSEEAKRGMGIQ